jgi:membrane associated rhomboid family serine protease
MFPAMWLHDPDRVSHIAGNMLVLAVLGAVVEPEIGSRRLLALFVAAGLGGDAMHWLVQPNSDEALVGASAGIAGVMAVGAVVRPCLLLTFVASYIGMNVVGLYASTPVVPPGVSVGAHIGGFCVGALLVLSRRGRGMRWAVA